MNTLDEYEYHYVDSPHTVQISFELLYPDWCKFQKSELYQSLVLYLEGLRNQENQNEKQEN